MRISDWSSDVCSSDLDVEGDIDRIIGEELPTGMNIRRVPIPEHPAELPEDDKRDDEARDGPDQDSERPDGRNDVIHAVALPCGWRIGKPHDRKTCGQRSSSSSVSRSEEHTSELQSLMRISYAVFCLKKKNS